MDVPWTKGKALSRTLHDLNKGISIQHIFFDGRVTHTGEVWIASNMASKIGLIKGRGGVTPHILTNNIPAREASSSLSLTACVNH